jgi:hypothetical protein
MVSNSVEPAITGRRPARLGPASLSSGPGPSGVRVRRAPLTLRHQAVGGVVLGDKVQPAAPASPSCQGCGPGSRSQAARSMGLLTLGDGFRVGPTPKQLLPSARVVGRGAGARAVAPNPFRVARAVAAADPTSRLDGDRECPLLSGRKFQSHGTAQAPRRG